MLGLQLAPLVTYKVVCKSFHWKHEMSICGLTCISVVLGFLRRNMALQSVSDVGDKDSSFSCEPTEHKRELQVEAQISCNAANISLWVNSQCQTERESCCGGRLWYLFLDIPQGHVDCKSLALKNKGWHEAVNCKRKWID